MIVSAIYAISENDVIGKDNGLPWYLPADLKHFKEKTLGKPIIMGRKTFDSMGKPLPKRRNIVVTRDASWSRDGVEVAGSVAEALGLAVGEKEVCIIGGAMIFEEAFKREFVNRIYLTIVHAEVDGDVVFHLPFPKRWQIVSVDARQADERNEYAFTFIEMELIEE